MCLRCFYITAFLLLQSCMFSKKTNHPNSTENRVDGSRYEDSLALVALSERLIGILIFKVSDKIERQSLFESLTFASQR